jgi:hypothetical protein
MNPQILASILKWLVNFFGKSDSGDNVVSATPNPAPTPVPAQPAVDWDNPACKISKHFTVKESTFLNSWQVSHVPSDVQKQAILGIAASMDKVADLLEKALGKPVSMNVHAWIRPDPANCPGSQWDGKDYNRYIYETQVWKDLTSAQKAEKHVPLSPHRTGHAVDFHISGYEGPEGCAKIRALILPHLEELGLRMEDITGGWVHLDDLPVVHERFFKP